MTTWRAPLPDHTVVRVRGDDPLGFLDATTSQEVRALTPGTSALSCLLDDKGHVLSEFRAIPMHDGSVLLDGAPAAREALTGWLARVAPLSGCEIIDESSMWRATATRNARATVDGVEFDDEVVRIATQWGGKGFDELAPDSTAKVVDADEIERARIEDGRVLFGIDVTPEMILNETPLISHAVSFTKGCYPGQETVAKIRNLGKPRRAFVVLRAEADIPKTDFDGGRVTSMCGNVALAFVRAEIAEQSEIDAGGVRAHISKIP